MTFTSKTIHGVRSAGAAAALLLLGAGGCSDSGIAYAPVSGIVRVDNEPIADAQVTFHLLETSASGDVSVRPIIATGSTDGEGRFALSSLTPDKRKIEGAAVGKHRVRVSTEIVEGGTGYEEPRTVRPEILAEKYNVASELTYEVPAGGTDECNFNLKSGR